MTFSIETLENDLKVLEQEKENAFIKYHQIVGAIAILSQQVQLKKQQLEKEREEAAESTPDHELEIEKDDNEIGKEIKDEELEAI